MPTAKLLDDLAHGDLSSALNRAVGVGILQRAVITVRHRVAPEVYRRKRYVRQTARDVLSRGINVALLSDDIAVGYAKAGLYARNSDNTWQQIDADQLRQRCTPSEIAALLTTASAALTQ